MRKNQVTLYLMLLLLGFSQLARGKPLFPVTITGPATACVGDIKVYTGNMLGIAGHTYSFLWSVTSGGTIVSPDPGNPESIQWTTAGTQTITLTVNDLTTMTSVGMATKVVTVYPIPAPYITTTTKVACQSFDSVTRGNGTISARSDAAPIAPPPPPPATQWILDDANGCPKVCANSYVKYFANGPAGSTFTWAVTGGTIVGPPTGPSILVHWGPVGSGSITLTDIGPGGCIGTATLCIDIIQPPIALFAIQPNTVPVSTYTTCLGDGLIFTDLSTPLPSIVSWQWFFGDGTSSSMENTTHTYAAAGAYNCCLVVTNQCGCTDTFCTLINVIAAPGPNIYCPRVVCQGDTASYSTSAVCAGATYTWTVSGGSIVSGAGTASIVVLWNTGDADGYGYVTLTVTGCGIVCPEPTTVKIDVIQRDPVITRPADPLCINEPYQFTVPIEGGNRYDWGVLGCPTCVIWGRHSNTAILQFTTPGVYTVHEWAQNSVTLCGNDTDFTVKVAAPPVIVGSLYQCVGSSYTYNLSPSYSGTWILTGPAGFTTTGGTGSSYTATFTVPGTYVLSVSGPGFCPPNPITIEVPATPPPPNTITGPLTVCPGEPYTYNVTAPVAGDVFFWSITSGAGTLSSTSGNSVTVTWTTLPGTLSVQRQTVAPPHCMSTPISLHVAAYPINPIVSGPITPCANSTQNYSDGYAIADATTWAIFPATLGSVASGEYSPNITVAWNNVTVPTPGTITVTVKKCGITVTNVLHVTVIPAPLMSITASPATICNTGTITFTSPSCGLHYTWNFGDGTPTVITTGAGANVTTHVFSTSYSTTSPVPYIVTVSVSGTYGVGCCPPIGMASMTVHVIPGPYTSISTPDPTVWCLTGPGISVNFSSVATNTSCPPTYQWYRNGVAIGGAIASTFHATLPGSYTVKVTDCSGCTVTSNAIPISQVSCSVVTGCGPTITMHSTVSCNVVNSTVTHPGTPTIAWYAPVAITHPGGAFTAQTTYTSPGYYTITAIETFPGPCTSTTYNTVTIPVIAHMSYDWNCATTPYYTVNLHDQSDLLAPFTLTTSTWVVTPIWPTVGPTHSSSGANYSLMLPPGNYTVTHTVVVDGVTCTVTEIINVPARTTVDFTTTPLSLPDNICEGVPVDFWASTTGPISSYVWNFGDGSTFLGYPPPTAHNFTYSSSTPLFYTYPVQLTVTNAIGCSVSVTHPVTIWHNNLAATVSGTNVVCSPPDVLSTTLLGGTPLYSYLWSPGGGTLSTDAVTATGAYFVSVTDAHRCNKVSAPFNAIVESSTPPVIYGNASYCLGDAIMLGAYMGAGYDYNWYLGTSSLTGGFTTSSDLTFTPTAAGTYPIHVVVTTPPLMGVVCTLTSAVFVVTVNPTPPAPVISGPFVISCPLYELQLNATDAWPGTFNWSSGTPGFGSTDIVYSGGGVRCWFTDLAGCVSTADILVPNSPESYMGYFPTGCYDFCTNFLGSPSASGTGGSGGGLFLWGPPDWFNFWDWLNNGTSLLSGSSSVITPLAITGPGNYQLELNNGLCTAISDTMKVSEHGCNCDKIFKYVTASCAPYGDPAAYILTLYIDNPYGVGFTATLGFDDGPVIPFTLYVPPGGLGPITLTFYTLLVPPPATANIWAHYAVPAAAGGTSQDCYDDFTVTLPVCSWEAERSSDPGSNGSVLNVQNIGASMLVYPNPANNEVNISYNYGVDDASADRRIVVYDILGRMVSDQKVTNVNGTLNVSLSGIAAGSFIVKMEENGKAVQVQHLSVTH